VRCALGGGLAEALAVRVGGLDIAALTARRSAARA
jgi:hypothetical protein